MLCGSLAVATAPRIAASASTSGSFSGGQNDAVIRHGSFTNRVSASADGCKAAKTREALRWVAAPGRGLARRNRTDTRLAVLYEPSAAEPSSDEEDIVVFASRDREKRRQASSSRSLSTAAGDHGSGSLAGNGKGKVSIAESLKKASPGARAAAASKAAREAKATMSAMREAEAHADRLSARMRSGGKEATSSGATSSHQNIAATTRRQLEFDDDDYAATMTTTTTEEETMETPRRPRPTTRRAAADALAKVNLARASAGGGGDVVGTAAAVGNGNGKTREQQKPKRKKRQQQQQQQLKLHHHQVSSEVAALKAKPVDAASAAAVLGTPSTSPKAPPKKNSSSGGGVVKRAKAASKTTKTTTRKKSTPSSQPHVHHAHVPAPTGSGAHKDDWNSFVDWKMMEHQDYQTIPDDQFEELSTKLHIKKKWRPMVSYLVSLGLTTKELEKVLVNCEELFKRPVAKILTRVEYLQNELGFEGADLRKLIIKEPKILLQRNRHSIPRCRYLTEVGVPPEKLCNMLRKQPQILHLSVEKGLKPRVAYFKNELLIANDEIAKLIERNPAVLTFSVENQIMPRVEFLKDMGISHENVSKMIVRHPHLLQYSFEGLEEHINFLSSIGMNEEEMVLTVTRLSQLFSLSVTNSLKPKFEYLTEELGGNVQTCVKFPAYFSLSLDQRIRPRHTFLKEFNRAPDPFPMKYLSENDTAFAARASKSLEDFVEYKEHVVPLFKQETERKKERAAERSVMEQRQFKMREARTEQQRRLMVKNQGYSQRIIDARNSMNRVKMLGISRKSR